MIFGKKRKSVKFVQEEENRTSFDNDTIKLHDNGMFKKSHDCRVFKQNHDGEKFERKGFLDNENNLTADRGMDLNAEGFVDVGNKSSGETGNIKHQVEKHHNQNSALEEYVESGLVFGKGGKRKEDTVKETKGQKVILHGLVSLCLVFMVFVVALMCGFVGGEDVVATFKKYNGVIYKGSETNNRVALMINVYWGTEYLEEMLAVLEKNNAKATFFVGKTWVEENPVLLKKMYSAGHEIGNHGSYHKEHGRLGFEQNKKEIDDCTLAVKKVLGIQMNLFAPPGGSYNKFTISAAESLGYETIMWTHDTIDWRDQNADLIKMRATSETVSGDLILMHPTKETAKAFEDIVLAINGKKLTLDTVSNTIKDQ